MTQHFPVVCTPKFLRTSALLSLFSLATVAWSCLERPVAPLLPQTNNQFIDQVRQTNIDKIDLLFMIDNSASMADKQTLLADAVPQLVKRLITPLCVDKRTGRTGDFSDSNGRCAESGLSPEFPPIVDFHIGIVTSSLGGHGAPGCENGTSNDRAHLLATVRGLPSWNSAGFLAWDPGAARGDPRNNPPGETRAVNLIGDFQNMVRRAGEDGCGYEAQLESWYRFLIDPEPPLTVRRLGDQTVTEGIDTLILEQRAAFLRPDSLVAIIMLTDENDCSVRDEGVGFRVAGPDRMPRATRACATDPNSLCCRPCDPPEANGPPPGCPALDQDDECKKGAILPAPEDVTGSMRCFNQKKRFGIDFLYPPSRYVQALKAQTLLKRDGKTEVINPLYVPAPKKAPRDPSLVFLAGIVGVPWQDIAHESSLGGAALRYLSADDLHERKRWEVILGDPAKNRPPLDPLMVESPFPRSGVSPIVNSPLAPEDSLDPQQNPINGHEYKAAPAPDDLQYACIFPLDRGDPCQGGGYCDCSRADVALNKPLCQPPGGGPATTTQYFAKGYPGLRELEVLRDFGHNAIVASICPKTTRDPKDPSYGYNPAVEALVDRLKEQLNGKCLPRPLSQDEAGRVPCAIVEALPSELTGGACSCSKPGRAEPSGKLRTSVTQHLQQNSFCGGISAVDCNSFCMCEIRQLEGADLETCQHGETPSTPGYCYIDEKTSGVPPEILNECPVTERHKLRFAYPSAVPGAEIPSNGAVTFIACLGASIGTGYSE